jgi:hypothetical protein
MTPVKRKLFDKLFQHHQRQLFQVVGTKATIPRSIFTKKLAEMKTAAEEEVYGAVNMTANKHLEFQVRLSHAGTEATTWNMADTDRIVSQLESGIYGITSNDQMQLEKEFSISLIEFEAWWQTISIQELWKPLNSM